MPENLNITNELQNGNGKALLVAVSTVDENERANRSLDELAGLLETAGGSEAAKSMMSRSRKGLRRRALYKTDKHPIRRPISEAARCRKLPNL